MSKKTLMLNADFSPFKLIHWRNGLVQTICDTKDSCYPVVYYDEWVIFDSSGKEYQIPAVIALKQYVDAHNKRAAYTKTNVFLRDKFVCQYCGDRFSKDKLTVDHVIPRSRWDKLGDGGRVSCFENIVTSCIPCNRDKADMTCKEAGMYPINAPRAATCREVFTNGLKLVDTIPPEWEPFIESVK